MLLSSKYASGGSRPLLPTLTTPEMAAIIDMPNIF